MKLFGWSVTVERKPLGFWRGPGFAKHHCQVPYLRKPLPEDGAKFICPCGNEWTWRRGKP